MESEISTLKDSNLLHRKRVNDMMMSLVKDLGEIGTAIAGSEVDIKVGRSPGNHRRKTYLL